MKTAGYSGTPLAKKLGIKEGCTIRLISQPDYYFTLFHDWPAAVTIAESKKGKKDLVHFFTTKYKEFCKNLPALKAELVPNGMIWISWPKKASKVPADMDEGKIRDLALQSGLVDIKVCAVDDIWPGLKLVIPVKDRG
jgi:hypothetical protein